MAAIHRLLCTHCTFGTSELESSSGDNVGKVLGYSVRKSSLPDAERGQLRQVFRAVERLLSYGLPKDATAAHKETLSADTAPRRLIFFPNLGGWQVAGQVSYRTFDTSQPARPGSYFADLIVAKAPDPRGHDPEPAWSPCDVLQLWGVGPDRKTQDQAGWWISSEDELAAAESEGPWKPIAPPSVAAVREPRPPLIDDEAAYRFLAADAVAADPLVPARWWAMPAERRRELVAHMLQATIQGPARGGRETVTIAAEPSVAAVLFYIVCRLLPRRIAAGVSFSTYEPAPERPLTGLVATTFLDEEAPTADLPPELAQRGFACNTFRDVSAFGRCQPPPEQGYARRLVALAAANDWVGIDSLLAALDAEGLKAAELDRLIEIDHLVTAYFRGEKTKGLGARRGLQEARFLRERFRGVLETQAATRADWPSDLLEAAIFCLEGDLENLWTAGGPVRALLERHLPDGDGLTRLLKPPQGMPSAPQSLVAAAVVSATLRRKKQDLPSSFVNYCAAASAGRDRETAKALLGEVIRGLPEEQRVDVLIGDEEKSASLADLLLDVARSLTPPDRHGLRPALTEALSNALKKLTTGNPDAAAELLARHAEVDAPAWISASHDDLQAQLGKFFHDVLNPNLGNHSGRYLVSPSGRSLVAGLQKWTDHARDRGQIAQLLSLWKGLHDAVTRLAANAPPWRSWAKPAAPEGSELAAAVKAIDGLRAFGPGVDPNNQKVLADAVIDKFKKAQPDGPNLHAGWETVRHWLHQALKAEADRRAPNRVRAAPGRSFAVMYAMFGGIAALIMMVGGLGAYSQGALDPVLPAAWRWQGERQVAPSPTAENQPKKAQPGDRSTASNTAGLDRPVATVDPPESAGPPPSSLTADSVDLQLKVAAGNISVKWNHDDVIDRVSRFELSWKGPKIDDKPRSLQPDKPDTPGQATIDTSGCDFGQYEVTLKISPKDKHSGNFEKSDRKTIGAPETNLKTTDFTVTDGKPRIAFMIVTPGNQEDFYGPVSIRLSGPENFSSDSKADPDGKVFFELPDALTPENYESLLPQFALATVTRQGVGPPVKIAAAERPDAKRRLLAELGEKQYITALDTEPGEQPQLLCELPWSLRQDQFDLWLMTPEFKPGVSMTLVPTDMGNKSPRWRCDAKVAANTGDQEAAPILIGHFEFNSISPWQRRLGFRPAGNRETDYAEAYAALRCCRICFVIDGQPVGTCQMRPIETMGRLIVSLREGQDTRELPKVATPPLLFLPRLHFNPEHSQGRDLTLHIEAHRSNQCVVVKREDESLTQATVSFNNGKPSINRSIWAPGPRAGKPYESRGKSEKERDLAAKTNVLSNRENELQKLEDEQRTLEQKRPEDRDAKDDRRLVELRTKLIPQAVRTVDSIQGFIEDLEETLARIGDVEAVNAAKFILDDWIIYVDTTVPDGTRPMPEGDAALESRVVLFKGSAKDPPIEFVSPPAAKSSDLPEPDAP